MEITQEGAERLAIGIIKQACNDYITGLLSEAAFFHFIRSGYFRLLTSIDPEYLIRKVKEERENYLNEKRKRIKSRKLK